MLDKYRDPRSGKPVDPATGARPLSEWIREAPSSGFAIHPDGFLIFLSPEEIVALDEYYGSDPYSVEENLSGGFHQMRIKTTVQLVELAASESLVPVRVLDVGSGEGHITEYLRALPQVAEAVGLDGSVSAIESGKKRYPSLDLLVGDAFNIPFVDGYFDIVVLNNIWEHVPDPLRMLAEIKRICREGGHLVVSTPSRYRTINLARVICGRDVTFISSKHVTEYTVGQVKEQLRYGGFDLEEVVSRPVDLGSFKANAVRNVFRIVAKAIRSHHSIDPTVFYLARNARPSGTEPASP
jgi:ubiquinone/menaquinone biosynthesis C-methylase UbiE